MSYICTTLGDIQDFIFNPELDTKALIQSNVLAPSISISFYIIVTYIGPHLMKNRKPYKIKYIIIFYNIVMIILNLYVVYGISILLPNFYEYVCPSDPQYQFRKAMSILKPYAWLFTLLKYAEFLDSIFFILRKRFDLLTVLHRVHHASMPVACVFFLKSTLSICVYLAVMFNTSIHIIMYFYYSLAACGPKYKKYLWWKRYLTILQMIQFLANIVCTCSSTITRCRPLSKNDISTALLSALFLILFLNYYIRQMLKISEGIQEKAE